MRETIDAVVAGHLCVDITPEFPSGSRTVGEIFRPGTLTNVGAATISTGGPVSNTALPMQRLGMNVKLMGKVGDDTFGRAVLEIIRTEAPGAEAGMVVVSGEKTSYTIVIAPPGIDRIFLHCTGSNDTFGSEDVDLDVVRRARLFHFGYPPLMARTYANGGAELVKIFQGARSAGATTSLDLVYTDPAGPAGRADWPGILTRTLPHVDIFTPSVEELLFMLGRERFDDLAARAADSEMVALIDGDLLGELGGQCLSAGAAVVLIKCGYLGMYVRTAGRDRLEELGRGRPGETGQWADRELFTPAYKVEKVVSGAGAGDCAIAGFLTAFLRGLAIDDAMRIGAAVGAQNVTAADTVSGVKSWDETFRQIRGRPPRQEVTIALEGFQHDPVAEHYTGPHDGGRR